MFNNVRQPDRRGFTLVELIVSFTILMLLTGMAVPLARSRVRKIKERDLRIALHDIRAAIDKYKDKADNHELAPGKQDAFGYPESLQSLVDGVKGAGPTADVKVRFLRHIPIDPMTNSTDWGVRSMQDDPKGQGGGNQNVFDIFSKTYAKAPDGTPYSEW